MADDRIKLRQVSLFREAARRGISRKMVMADGGYSESTVRSWADGTHEMPIAALDRLAVAGALPPDLLSLLLGDGFALVRQCGGLDHAALAGQALGYVSEYAEDRHPDSEAGSELGPGETARLNACAARLHPVRESSG